MTLPEGVTLIRFADYPSCHQFRAWLRDEWNIDTTFLVAFPALLVAAEECH